MAEYGSGELVGPSCSLSFAPDGDVWSGGFEEIEGKAPQDCEVLRSVIGSVSCAILVEGGVEHPMAGFDAPMRAHGLGQAFASERRGTHKVAPTGGGASLVFDHRLDHAQAGQTIESRLVALAAGGDHPGDVVADAVVAGLDPPVACVNGGVNRKYGMGVREVFDCAGEHSGTVALEAEQPVAAALAHQSGGGTAAMQGIGGDQHAAQVDQAQHFAGCDLLAAAGLRAGLGEHQLALGGKGGDDVQRRAFCDGVEGATQCLAVDCNGAWPDLAEVIEEAGEAGGEVLRVEQAEQAREGVMAGQAARQFEELLKQGAPILGKVRELDATFRATDRGGQRNCKAIQQVMALGVACPRVRQVFKTAGKPNHRVLPTQEARR